MRIFNLLFGRAASVLAGLALGAASIATSAQTVTYFHNDPSGSPLMATDAMGALLWKENYRPYGSKYNNAAGSNTNAIGFAGRPHDASSGLSYMDARYYDPVLGRFLGVDPAPVNPESVHGINRYAYANNNPARYVDPDGHSPLDVAFLVWDLGKLSMAVYSGNPAAIAEAATDVAMSVVGVASPIPGTGQALKAARAAGHAVEAVRNADRAVDTVRAAKAANTSETTTVIGRVKDLQNLGPGEKSLLDRLPYLGNQKANWQQNAGILREEMRLGRPIRDASAVDTAGQFLNAERNLLRDRGWTLDPQTNLWMPPKP